MVFRFSTALVVIGCVVAGFSNSVPTRYSIGAEPESKTQLKPIVRSDADWKKLLTTKQFDVTRRGGTESAYSGKLWHNKQPGSYHCVCCDLELFKSQSKYDSHTGWPSFWQPVAREHIKLAADVSELPPRTEVLCARCDAHLGHLFGDGPPPTGLRFCMNSAALTFAEASENGKSQKTPEHSAKAHEK